MTGDDTNCTHAREWLCAYRDDEADDDALARSHLDTCNNCQCWSATFDRVTRHARLRAPMAPAPVTATVTRIAREAPPVRHATFGRVLLGIAAASGPLVLILDAAGVFGHSHLGSTDGRHADVLTTALYGGYALAAWRPDRLAAGLLPVAVLAAAITLALSVVDVTSGAVSILDELSHLPLLIGAAGAAVATRASQPVAAPPTDRTTHTPIAHSV
ncbi:MAG: hypothetical protein JJU45_17275 [Acidimicrobiia bacterium]|nr:hypothetical protein [Acidimicrobiia bacterium]